MAETETETDYFAEDDFVASRFGTGTIVVTFDRDEPGQEARAAAIADTYLQPGEQLDDAKRYPSGSYVYHPVTG
jgi:hypothetical protein